MWLWRQVLYKAYLVLTGKEDARKYIWNFVGFLLAVAAAVALLFWMKANRLLE